MKPNDFIKKYKPYTLQTEAKKGIPYEFTLAQAALESSWGARVVGNMFFGVKANPQKYPENKKQLLITREVLDVNTAQFPEILSITKLPSGKYEYRVKDWFRKYDTPEESFTDHADFFYDNPRYTDAIEEISKVQNLKKIYDTTSEILPDAIKQVNKKLYEDARQRLPYIFADEIAKAGYATDPNYAKILKSVIDTIKKYE